MFSILLALAAGPALDCTYATRSKQGTTTAKGCAARGADGSLRIAPRQVQRLLFAPGTGLAEIRVGSGWYYVRRDGVAAPVMNFDNGPDDFAGGLARSPRGTRIGYVDARLRLAIAARFDGAYRFANGRAMVCFGCKVISDGEHSSYAGGAWGCIDRSGREIRRRIGADRGHSALEVCD